MDEDKMKEENNRRPLKVRGVTLAKQAAAWLAMQNITPNQISILSVFFALLAAISLFLHNNVDLQVRSLLLVLSAVFIQCRLLCNLFDGMVAVEGGKSTNTGELFNDIPDRIADPLILIAVAYGISGIPWSIELGWMAALLAVMTAYIRTLACSVGVPADFRGPMAKQQRMALISVVSLVSMLETYWWPVGNLFFYSLIMINLGCLITIFRRIRFAYDYLERV